MAKSGLTEPQSPGMQMRNIRRKAVCTGAVPVCRHTNAVDTTSRVRPILSEGI
jgi:hypothetical protein